MCRRYHSKSIQLNQYSNVRLSLVFLVVVHLVLILGLSYCLRINKSIFLFFLTFSSVQQMHIFSFPLLITQFSALNHLQKKKKNDYFSQKTIYCFDVFFFIFIRFSVKCLQIVIQQVDIKFINTDRVNACCCLKLFPKCFTCISNRNVFFPFVFITQYT